MQILPALLLFALVGVLVWFQVKILHKTGFSGWWAITQFVPLVGLIFLWIFAYAEWPAQKSGSGMKPSGTV